MKEITHFYNMIGIFGSESLARVGLEDSDFVENENNIMVFGAPVIEIVSPSSENYDQLLSKLQQRGVIQ